MKKKGFPFGIFFILLIIQILVVVSGTGYYLFHSTKKGIANIERFTRNYSLTLFEAFTEVAELCYQNKDYKKLKNFFQQKIHENTIDEAFFVLTDGILIVHSNKNVEDELKGNIANDEFAYNVELILKPVRLKSRDIQITDYNIMGYDMPKLLKKYRHYLKKYVHEKIDRVGWLFSKAVYSKGNPIGTVNFLISKKRIYDFILGQIGEGRRILVGGLVGAAGISFIISCIVFIRYRSIQKNTLKFSDYTWGSERFGNKRAAPRPGTILSDFDDAGDEGLETTDPTTITITRVSELDEDLYRTEKEDTVLFSERKKVVSGRRIPRASTSPSINDESWVENKNIKDAIPVVKRT